ncbi:hypothetical protein QR98_0054450 [Sarcoptes scabiei]|uniref:Uncharacterized protein n=1 Tax=Sarcoptes scabiei TaxID=52283 RepID=A0A132A7L5_SARSC|nr:hypothetical protein QR98_0054450 [Sarcoptes scabiei]
MNLYGINETDFEMFFKSKPSSTLELSVAKQRSKSESIQISKTLHHLYQSRFEAKTQGISTILKSDLVKNKAKLF